jgi:hypothetical protein
MILIAALFCNTQSVDITAQTINVDGGNVFG